MKTKDFYKIALVSITIAFSFVSCKKDSSSDNNINTSQLRTANAFGQTIPQRYSCLKKAYVTGQTDTTYYNYNSDWSLSSTIIRGSSNDTTRFTYDNLHRLISINIEGESIVFDYGSSANQAQKIIVSAPADLNDTIYLTYPGGNKIVANIFHHNWTLTPKSRDTLEFDVDNNLIKYNIYSTYPSGNYEHLFQQVNFFNSGIKDPLYTTPYVDYTLAKIMIEDGSEFYPRGKSILSEMSGYEFNPAPSLQYKISLVDYEVNAGFYPTKVKYTDGTNFRELNFGYSCD